MKAAILGTVGVPGRYGGFETLAENLVRQHQARGSGTDLAVYCSAPAYDVQPSNYLGASLYYSRWKANGLQSVLYDATTLLQCVWRGCDVVLLLGVSGASILPVIRLVSRMRIVTNVDGIEWRRDKWKGFARHFLRFSEWMAVRFSHEVVADNQGIADYLSDTYGISPKVIAYGGDHAVNLPSDAGSAVRSLPCSPGYALALCRIEPENNIDMILQAFASSQRNLVFVGNWDSSDYGRRLRSKYAACANLHLLDPIYDPDELYRVRIAASFYVHGHSAGGTNPSLVEMMHFGLPVVAFDCVYNRHTTEGRADYFRSSLDLSALVAGEIRADAGARMKEIADRKYRWSIVADQYFEMLSAQRQTSATLLTVNQGKQQ
ncbi:DUF1972 domain-containing protein [Rhizobium sp. AG855]|uniref:DUF1972 domain-containing protein n=1 Tax=Rhizobium sp. AG855 TaxID=2183898 RepID=UPI000E76AACE|nr:DUF1972 domain-containing protein [Rhizobium sp. AG855]RKE79231.1 glycosyltransferase involved in cell wall biosynthesis [Rhizobium sp. AG855]